MTTMTFTGSCLCGEVRYEISGEAKKFYHCHCKRCRKASGTGHATNLLVIPDAVHWIKGEERIASFKVPDAERFTSRFCTNCGSQVPRFVKETGFMVIPAGSLDSDAPIEPQARIFWGSRAGWSCSGDELPVFAELPPSK